MERARYVSALSLRWLTPFYDALVEGPMVALGMRSGLLTSLGDLDGKSVLDVGCGTGAFAILAQRAYPNAQIAGLDGDPEILEIARQKARELGMAIEFSEAMSFAMPYPDGSFGFVVTSLMLHHLSKEAKQGTAAEMCRVLKPGGMLLGLDLAEPRSALGRGIRPITRHFERAAENLDGLLPSIFAQAGLTEYTELRRYLWGSVALFRAFKAR